MDQFYMEHEKVFFSVSFSSPPGFETFEETTSILFKKVNEEKIGDFTLYLEDGDSSIFVFNAETLTFTLFQNYHPLCRS